MASGFLGDCFQCHCGEKLDSEIAYGRKLQDLFQAHQCVPCDKQSVESEMSTPILMVIYLSSSKDTRMNSPSKMGL